MCIILKNLKIDPTNPRCCLFTYPLATFKPNYYLNDKVIQTYRVLTKKIQVSTTKIQVWFFLVHHLVPKHSWCAFIWGTKTLPFTLWNPCNLEYFWTTHTYIWKKKMFYCINATYEGKNTHSIWPWNEGWACIFVKQANVALPHV